MHGFINVFAGALFASAGLAGTELRALLAERRAESFQWTGEALTWEGHTLGTERIRELRSGQVASYGSCSFSEPCEDLRALGWL
ncbi:MAG: hypothetical protein R3E97_12790 [Candidatus Eisenbacteria bacterium]